ncbi:MAG: glutamyl-tRNA reductase [Verrucomicrobiota bacterium]|nr:glutamyl-tRNA reductase [Verrucomicrobiota bacterium]
MSLIVVGLSHHTCPVSVREKFAFGQEEIAPSLAKMQQSGLADECVLLSTCNRVEVYVASPFSGSEAFERIHHFLQKDRGCEEEALLPSLYSHVDSDCIEHLFKVASGLDSLVLGETEILGQLKDAYQCAVGAKSTGKALNKLFQKAFHVAKHIRSNTGIQRGSTSVGSVAVELAERIFDGLEGKRVMVIGAGDTSEKTARSLLSRGASELLVTNRSIERARALADELDGRAVAFEDWQEEFHHLDIVISSTSAPTYVLNRLKVQQLIQHRPATPLLLIDIAVPRDIDPEINELENVYVYNIDHLQSIAQDYLEQRQSELTKCETYIRSKAQEWLEAWKTPPKRGEGTDSYFQAGPSGAS